MDIVERSTVINENITRIDSTTEEETIEIALRTLKFSRTKVSHSDVRTPPVHPIISLEEVADHDDPSDCWIIVYDRVYNVTGFLEAHPGGEDVILDYGGRDATLAFRGTGHSKAALKLLEEHVIGELPPHQRLFRRNSRPPLLQLSDVPE